MIQIPRSEALATQSLDDIVYTNHHCEFGVEFQAPPCSWFDYSLSLRTVIFKFLCAVGLVIMFYLMTSRVLQSS